MNSRPRGPSGAVGGSLNVLDLLAHLLELGLGRGDELRDAQTIGLRTHGVYFAVHLLQQEIELPAAWLGGFRQRGPVRHVASEAGDFLADVRSRCRPDNLLG